MNKFKYLGSINSEEGSRIKIISGAAQNYMKISEINGRHSYYLQSFFNGADETKKII